MNIPEIETTPFGPRASVSGPIALAGLLVELEQVVQAVSARTDLGLAPGLPPEEVESTLATVGLRANAELLTWFGWHNGLERSNRQIAWRTLPGIIPGSLQDLVRIYRTDVLDFVAPVERGVVVPQRFFTYGLGFGWLPLEVDSTTRYAVSCFGESNAIPLIRRAEPEYFQPAWHDKLQAVSLCTPVAWWLQGVASGAHLWNKEQQRWDEPDSGKLPPSQIAAGFD